MNIDFDNCIIITDKDKIKEIKDALKNDKRDFEDIKPLIQNDEKEFIEKVILKKE